MTKLLLLASVLSLTACATDGPSSSQPVATYTSRTGTTIEIFAEGDVAYSAAEQGDGDHLALAIGNADLDTLSPTQVYLMSATDAIVPTAISELTDSLAAAGRKFAPTPTADLAQLTPSNFDGCLASEFSQSECANPDGQPITWCLLGLDSNEHKHFPTVSELTASLCMRRGSALYHITNGAGGDHTWSMGTGGFIRYSFSSAFLSTDWLHMDITNASENAFFHFAGNCDP